MLDLSLIQKSCYKIKIDNLILSVEPAKVKTIKKVLAIANLGTQAENEEWAESDEGIEALKSIPDDIVTALVDILKNNKEKITITNDFVEDHFSYDEMSLVLADYLQWLYNTKKSKNWNPPIIR